MKRFIKLFYICLIFCVVLATLSSEHSRAEIINEIEELDTNLALKHEVLKLEKLTQVEEEEIEIEVPDDRLAAFKVWSRLNEEGYSDHAKAGILGNMMAEVGGQTLHLQYWLYGGSYYGLCQWSSQYFPEVQGASLDAQIDFLMSTMEKQFKESGYSLENFKNSTDCSNAALVFAKAYERCASRTYGVRQENAMVAYEYFKSLYR